MKLSSNGVSFIQKWEELRLKAYRDVKGVWTIGYGHTKTAEEYIGQTITQERATYLFNKDVAWAEEYVDKRIKTDTTQAQFDAMVSLTFNIGKGGFRTSTVLRLHNMNWDFGACAAFLMWHWSGGKRYRGLLRRRCEEAALYCSEPWGHADG